MGISALIGAIVGGIEAIGSGIAAAGTAIAADLGITGVVGSAIGTGLEGAVFGGALGAGEAALTGHNVWEGLGLGALTGGAIGGFGPLIGDVTGLGAGAADAIAGAGAGALGSALTHQNPLTGALEGGLAGFATGSLQGVTSAGGGGGSASGAAGAAAPASVAGGPDVGGVPAAISGDTGLSSVNSNLPGDVGAGAASGGADLSGAGSGIGAGVPAPQGIDIVGQPAPGTGINGPGSIQPFNPGITDVTPFTDGASAVAGVPPASTVNVPSATAIQPVGNVEAFNPGITLDSGGAAPGGGLSGLLRNPGLLLAGGGLAADFLKGQKVPAYEKQLEAEAAMLQRQGGQLRGYELSGTLPPGMEAGLDAATANAGASIVSQYSSRGMDNTSAEAQDMQSLALREDAQRAAMAAQLFQQGVQDTQMANGIYQGLLNVELQQDQEMSNAISNFAASLARMSMPVQPVTS